MQMDGDRRHRGLARAVRDSSDSADSGERRERSSLRRRVKTVEAFAFSLQDTIRAYLKTAEELTERVSRLEVSMKRSQEEVRIFGVSRKW